MSDIGELEESVTGVGVPNVLLAAAHYLERGDVLGARYQIEAVIGTGGSGRVLRAFDREARMPVALKILRPEFAADPVWTERFSRELRIGRSIIHPNVCRVFDIGDADGHKFLSMELASGGSIRADVPRIGATRVTPTRPQRSWPERIADAQSVVEGVAALHAAGIVHRDIKPENILRMEDGRLVVTDFGLATDPGANAGNTVMVGTPSYMAPEVVMGDPATARSDVWGLGIVLHEILFGCRPQWKCMGRGYRRFVPPDDLTTSAQRAAAELCGRCADDSPEVRPASAVEVSTELTRALRGRRRFTRPRGRQIVWGALAVASFATLGLIRERWSNRAQASLSAAASSLAERTLTPTGTPEDWSQGATKLAAFEGKLRCLSLVENNNKVRAIWGSPPRAEDFDVKTGARTSATLPAESYEEACPSLSPDGADLLFVKASDTGPHIYLARLSEHGLPRQIVAGTAPNWLPNGKEFAFSLDSRHVAIFSIPAARMQLVTDETGDSRIAAEHTIDASGTRLAVRYTTESLENLVVVHGLPGLEVIGRSRLSPSARGLQFSKKGDLLFSAEGPSGSEELLSVDWGKSKLSRLARVSQQDLRLSVESSSGRVFATRSLTKDLWIDGSESRIRLTSDGESYSGALSGSGDLVAIQRRNGDGTFAIVVRDRREGTETILSDHFLDVAPSFSPDGKSVIFARYNTGEIVECRLAGKTCARIAVDPSVPIYPTIDPSGTRVAYLTAMNSSRLKVVGRNAGVASDLGPASAVDGCPPIWVDERRLWVLQSMSGTGAAWARINTDTGRSEELLVAPSPSNRQECTLPPAILTASRLRVGDRVVALGDETTTLLRIER